MCSFRLEKVRCIGNSSSDRDTGNICAEFFPHIFILLDSTAFQVIESYKDIYPGSGGCSQASGVKIQLEYELKSGNLLNMQVGSGFGSDNTFGSKIRGTIKHVYEFYSLRWQVEIIFKTWKSIFHIHAVKQVKIERFQIQYYLIWFSLMSMLRHPSFKYFNKNRLLKVKPPA